MAPNSSGVLSHTPSPTFSAAPTAHSSSPSFDPCKIDDTCRYYNEDDPRDASKNLKQPCHGWPKLVEVMVENSSFESFQAFRDLNIKSLLYYQAELVQLRKELHALEWKDHRKGGDSSELSSNVRSLLLTKPDDDDDDDDDDAQEQFNKLREIRKALKEYNAALLQYAKINELPKAEAFNVKSLRQWIEAHHKGALNIFGPGSESWGKIGHESDSIEPTPLGTIFKGLLRSIFCEEKPDKEQIDLDLVVPAKSRDADPLTRWVASQWVPFWNRFSETQFCRILSKPFRHKQKEGEKLPGLMSERTHSNASTFNSFTRWMLFQKQPQVPTRKEDSLASLATYSSKSMIRFTNRVATIVACLFPIIGIVVLSRLHTQAKILGFIALFTATFAMGIMALTSSTSRTEIFTVTAAFAAVMVVFVQKQSPGGY